MSMTNACLHRATLTGFHSITSSCCCPGRRTAWDGVTLNSAAAAPGCCGRQAYVSGMALTLVSATLRV
jgi:hypothetical protein